MGSKYTKNAFVAPTPGRRYIFGAFRVQGTCLVAVHVVLLLLNENKRSKNVLNILYVTVQSLSKHYMIIFTLCISEVF